ncbi:alpha/beta family hydrolase [Litorilituus sediminis]|uniref:KANL3/Tex30 alpha/beta hydrolase-like domain-containing protein n=1 Tax=Litorilituus sediminis TaxID=718192 RepID=A0A4P6PCT3_9GAMM|nr:alpha/beta family hydrolase [Litorilituus sediminis]QBG37582.1 hypothetical protein EMK97_18530 [Litorilituus sediminis]
MSLFIKNTVDDAIAQLVLAHGAGANMHHEFLEKMTELLNQQGLNVIRFNFPYMEKRAETGKRYPPDRMPVLLSHYSEVITTLLAESDEQKNASLPLFIGGKSMGSRVAVSLLAKEGALPIQQQEKIAGAFCFGYPFHPAKKPEKLRLEPLQETSKPVLIVQGERDSLGSEQEIAEYEVSPLCRYQFLADGDHSLKPRVKSGFRYDEHLANAALAVRQFIDNIIAKEA